MTETIIGIVFGVLATIAVSHYYYRRTTKKRLTPYLMLKNHVFDGIDKSVRDSLKFTFRDEVVDDLHQLEFLVANDGNRAIKDCLEPLVLELPHTVNVLDVSIVHKRPPELSVSHAIAKVFTGNPGVAFNFPLLNEGDYFVVKMLLSGVWKPSSLAFRIVAEDLPRKLETHWLEVGATEEQEKKIDRSAIIGGLVFLLAALCSGYVTYLLYDAKPAYFPVPWRTFVFHPLPLSVLVAFIIWSLALAVFGVGVFFGVGLGDIFRRKPRFPLPEELRRRVVPFDPKYLAEFETALQTHLAEQERQKARGEPEPASGG